MPCQAHKPASCDEGASFESSNGTEVLVGLPKKPVPVAVAKPVAPPAPKPPPKPPPPPLPPLRMPVTSGAMGVNPPGNSDGSGVNADWKASVGVGAGVGAASGKPLEKEKLPSTELKGGMKSLAVGSAPGGIRVNWVAVGSMPGWRVTNEADGSGGSSVNSPALVGSGAAGFEVGAGGAGGASGGIAVI